LMVNVVQKVLKDLMVFQEHKVNKARLVLKEHVVLMDNLVFPELTDPMDPRARVANPVQMDHEELLVHKDRQSTDVMVFPENVVLLALQAPMAMPAKTAIQDLLDRWVYLVQEELMVLMASQDLQVERDWTVNLDRRASKAQPARTRRQTWSFSEPLLRRLESNF